MRIAFRISVLRTDPLKSPRGNSQGHSKWNRASGNQGMILKSNIQDTGIPEEREGAEEEKNEDR